MLYGVDVLNTFNLPHEYYQDTLISLTIAGTDFTAALSSEGVVSFIGAAPATTPAATSKLEVLHQLRTAGPVLGVFYLPFLPPPSPPSLLVVHPSSVATYTVETIAEDSTDIKITPGPTLQLPHTLVSATTLPSRLFSPSATPSLSLTTTTGTLLVLTSGAPTLRARLPACFPPPVCALGHLVVPDVDGMPALLPLPAFLAAAEGVGAREPGVLSDVKSEAPMMPVEGVKLISMEGVNATVLLSSPPRSSPSPPPPSPAAAASAPASVVAVTLSAHTVIGHVAGAPVWSLEIDAGIVCYCLTGPALVVVDASGGFVVVDAGGSVRAGGRFPAPPAAVAVAGGQARGQIMAVTRCGAVMTCVLGSGDVSETELCGPDKWNEGGSLEEENQETEEEIEDENDVEMFTEEVSSIIRIDGTKITSQDTVASVQGIGCLLAIHDDAPSRSAATTPCFVRPSPTLRRPVLHVVTAAGTTHTVPVTLQVAGIEPGTSGPGDDHTWAVQATVDPAPTLAPSAPLWQHTPSGALFAVNGANISADSLLVLAGAVDALAHGSPVTLPQGPSALYQELAQREAALTALRARLPGLKSAAEAAAAALRETTRVCLMLDGDAGVRFLMGELARRVEGACTACSEAEAELALLTDQLEVLRYLRDHLA